MDIDPTTKLNVDKKQVNDPNDSEKNEEEDDNNNS